MQKHEGVQANDKLNETRLTIKRSVNQPTGSSVVLAWISERHIAKTYLFRNILPRIQEGTSIDILWLWNQTDKLRYFGRVDFCCRRSESEMKDF